MKKIFLLIICTLFLLKDTYAFKKLKCSWNIDENDSLNSLLLNRLDLYISLWDSISTQQELDSFWIKPKISIDSCYDLGFVFLTNDFGHQEFLKYFHPLVLDREKIGINDYKYRVAFIKNDSNKINPRSQLFAIYDYNFSYLNGNWFLKNNFDYSMNSFYYKRVGIIDYYYKSKSTFNKHDAKKNNEFINQISKKIKLEKAEEFKFFMVDDVKDVSKLFNFSFSFVATTSGYTHLNGRFIISALGSAYYPHETVHIIEPKNTPKWLSEGMAVYFGGSRNEKYHEIIKKDTRLNDSLIHIIIDSKEIPFWLTYTFSSLTIDYIYNDLNQKDVIPFFDKAKTFPDFLIWLSTNYYISPNEFGNIIKEKLNAIKSKL